MPQIPMIAAPLKQTSEVDWIVPLKAYIRDTYQDDPERYAEECATLNRLRQDMRGAGKDSASGRDLLYRYYGQLELLDLRFPVDENHIKIAFTWFDAFTHKPISQYSLAYEKASIIFNISAVLSCHAANQNRSDDTGLKMAYHSFQASAGMFNYINENFLHAPSTDLNRDTVKTLIAIMLAQGQEVFLEKQLADEKKAGLLAKLASQAATLYAQAVEGVNENVSRGVFEKVWLQMVQIKASYMSSLAQYYQALADEDANAHGTAIARLQIAEREGKEASRIATAFPSSIPAAANLAADTGSTLSDAVKRHLTNVQERLASTVKDNDFIYHQTVPAEAALSVVPKLPAAKPIPVTELYQGQDIQRIIGPDIFQRIVPMAVTESASLYDEEKAKLVRAEVERVEQANDEMAASLDYLKLPGSLDVLKGGMNQDVSVDPEFRRWCEDLAGHDSFDKAFTQLHEDRATVISILDACMKNLDLEESVCEKMRLKYTAEWSQQPSSRLNATLRSDVRTYREAIDQAGGSDAQLLATSRQFEVDFDEMRSAGETDEADVLYQRALIKAGGGRNKSKSGGNEAEGNLLDEDYGEGGTPVAEQIARIEEMLKKLNLVKKDRTMVLKDLKEKVHNDDISNVLILNKKSIANHEKKLFEAELEKFRPHQNRLLQANHKQGSLMKELTRAYGDLLQDKRVRSEQAKYDSVNRQRNAVLTRYRKVYGAFNDLIQGLERAQAFYSEMHETVVNLEKNVDSFVKNRRDEGAHLLAAIDRQHGVGGGNGGGGGSGPTADQERDRLRNLMERMAISPNGANSSTSPPPRSQSRSGSALPGTAGTPAPGMAPPAHSSKPSQGANPGGPGAYAAYPPASAPYHRANPSAGTNPPPHPGSTSPPGANARQFLSSQDASMPYPAAGNAYPPYTHPGTDPASTYPPAHPPYGAAPASNAGHYGAAPASNAGPYGSGPSPSPSFDPRNPYGAYAPHSQSSPPPNPHQPPHPHTLAMYPPYGYGHPSGPLPHGFVPPPPPPGPPPASSTSPGPNAMLAGASPGPGAVHAGASPVGSHGNNAPSAVSGNNTATPGPGGHVPLQFSYPGQGPGHALGAAFPPVRQDSVPPSQQPYAQQQQQQPYSQNAPQPSYPPNPQQQPYPQHTQPPQQHTGATPAPASGSGDPWAGLGAWR